MKTAGAGSRLTRFLSLSYGLIPGLFLLNFIYPSSWVQGALAALTTATLAATLVALKNIFAPISAILLLLGAWNLWQQGLPFQDWLGAVIGKVDLFCLLLVLRFFEFPIQLGNYNYHVTDFALRKVKTGRQFFVLSTLVTYIFSIASDYASFQIIFSTLKERCREPIPSPERFLTAVIKRSVGLSQMISPVCPTLALVLTLSGITWIDYAPYGALVSGTGLLLSLVSACYLSPAFRNLRDLKFEPGSGAAGEKPQRRRVVQFFAIMIAIIVLIVLLDLKTGLNMLQVLFLVSLIVPPLWSLLIGRPREFGQKISRFFTRDAADFSTIFALVISAGFLSGTLVPEQFQFLQHLLQGEMWLAVVIIPLTVILLTLLGINAFIGVAIVGGAAGLLPLEIPPAALALALISGAVTANIVSPFSASSLIMSNLTGKPPLTVSFRWNGLYSIALLACSLLITLLIM